LLVEPPTPIELARRDRGWRQADLAAHAGVSRHTIALSERGYRPSEKSRRKIADALESSVAALWVDAHNDYGAAANDPVGKASTRDAHHTV
jgi:DNA-binding XRE family transcriptional regulator